MPRSCAWTTSASGREVTTVQCERRRPATRGTYAGSLVVVACGAANSARLLLASANEKHPRGLANSSDQVGRNYMFHNSPSPWWRFRGGRTPQFSKKP
jgi:choline dehydrogenase-like flavoprotein